MMYGYVTLGGHKFEAFLWEDAEPKWFECVVLYSKLAVEHEVVSLHFRVPADRVFVDDKVRENLDSTSTAIAEKCKKKLANNEKIGKKVSFALPDMMEVLSEDPNSLPVLEDTDSLPALDMQQIALSEEEMALEVERMLSRMDSGTPRVNVEVDDEEFLDGAMLYEAEEFGGTFVDEKKSERGDFGGESLRKASTIKRHLIEQFLDSPQLSLVTPGDVSTPEEMHGWAMDLDDRMVEGGLSFDSRLTRVSTQPDLNQTDELPPMDEEPSLGDRKAAFVSTRGKEREIWMTYREEITATWRAELEVLRRDLFSEASHVGA